MPSIDNIDQGKPFDWGKTSSDYAKYRPGYPTSFYNILSHLGIGLPGQNILDLGTGTGELAINFALRKAHVTGIDISPEQIEMAKKIAEKNQVAVDFYARPAEDLAFLESGKFDAITASCCWVYFDRKKLIPEIKRLLKKDGLLLMSSLFWLPFKDEIAGLTEKLILKHNPDWSASGYTDEVDPLPDWAIPDWALSDFQLKSLHKYKADIEFSHESYRGRMRACRAVGASLPPDTVADFDRELEELLKSKVPDPFTVKHAVMLRIFELKSKIEASI